MRLRFPSASKFSSKTSPKTVLQVELLEDRNLPSAALPLDPAGLEGSALLADDVFATEASHGLNASLLKALAALQQSQGLAGNAAAPQTGESGVSGGSAFSAQLAVNAGPVVVPQVTPAAAPTIVVNTLVDETTNPNTTSLREAITLANAPANFGSTITFSSGLSGIVSLTGGALPQLTNSTTITGPGAGTLAISGLNTVRILDIAASISVSISGLTIENGNDGSSGGAINNLGNLTVTDCTFTGNIAGGGSGGAIYNDAASSLTAVNSTFTSNNASAAGGAVAGMDTSILGLSGCSFVGNTATFSRGGAVFAANTIVQVAGCDFVSNNSFNDYSGGAISVDTSTVTVTGSSFSQNFTDGNGGAIYSTACPSLTVDQCSFTGNIANGTNATNGGAVADTYSVAVSLTNCSFTNNSATSTAANEGKGGALYLKEDLVQISQCSVANNTANQQGGGIDWYSATAGDAFTIANSLIDGNTAQNATSQGGGLHLQSMYVTTTITGCTISNNRASEAAGIRIFGDSQYVLDSTISNNTATGNAGGVSTGGGVTFRNTTISGNTAGGNGGGLYIDIVFMYACTVSDNTAGTSGGGAYVFNFLSAVNSTFTGNTAATGSGGALFAHTDVALTNSTVAFNKAGGLAAASTNGGGIYLDNYYNSVLYNTIVAQNTSVAGAASDIGIDTSDAGLDGASANNLIGTGGSGGLVNGVNGNMVGVADAGLRPLGYYGGTTQTLALLPTSLAVNAGSVSVAKDAQGNSLTTDQRGFARVVGNSVDIGAFELQASGTPTMLVVSAPPLETLGSPIPVSITVEDDFGNRVTNYFGTVSFSAQVPSANLFSYTFTAANAGQATIFVPTTGLALGSYTLNVNDVTNHLFGQTDVTLLQGGAFFTDGNNQLYEVLADGTIINTGAFATRLATTIDPAGNPEAFFTDGNNQIYRYDNGTTTALGAFATGLVAGRSQIAFTDGANQIYLYNDNTASTVATGSFATRLVGGFGANGSQYAFTDGFNQVYAMDATGAVAGSGAFATQLTQVQDGQGNLDVYFTDGNNQIYRFDLNGTTQTPGFAKQITGAAGLLYFLDGNNQVWFFDDNLTPTQTIGFAAVMTSNTANSAAYFLDGQNQLYELLPSGTFIGTGGFAKLFSAF